MDRGFGIGRFGMFLTDLFWIAVIVGIILLIKHLLISIGGKSHRATSEDSALEILKRRYARGEINKEEFDQKKSDQGY